MNTHRLLCTALVGALACSADPGGSDVSDPNASPMDQRQSLGRGESDSDGQCRGRSYWICKDARTPHSPKGDVALIDSLVPHHRMAIEMADMEIARGDDAEVKVMAQKMKTDQAMEIESLLRIREELTGCTRVTQFPAPHAQEDMDRMRALAGRELDISFLESMIPHHAGAIEFTHNALPVLMHPELAELAHEVIDAQSMETGEMHAKKKELAP